MALAPTRLDQRQLTATTETASYTVPVGKTAIIKQVVVANTSTSGVAFGLSVVPSGGTAGVANRYVPDATLQPLTSTIIDVSWVLTAGDFVSVKAGTANVLVVSLHGLLG